MRPGQLAQGEPARGADHLIFDFVLSRQVNITILSR
jgi:hypothetical protein